MNEYRPSFEERCHAVEWLKGRAPKFARSIAPLYAVLRWCWEGSPDPPSREQILKTILILIDDVCRVDCCQSNTGGITVEIEKQEDGAFMARMSFEYDMREYFDFLYTSTSERVMLMTSANRR